MAGCRVHFLVTDLQIGGTPRVVKELAIRLRPLGFDPHVACLSPWGPVADELKQAGVPVTAFGARGTIDLPRTIRRARRWLADAEVAISFLVHANAVATWALRGSDVPLIQSIQTTQPRPIWHWWLQGVVGRSARRIVVPSESVVQAAVERSGLPREAFVVIPNAVDDPNPPARDRVNEPFKIGFIGRLDPVKRVPDLIAALTRLPDMRLSLFGEGPERRTIENAIRHHQVADRVTLHGQVASVADALRSIDVLVLPSEAEGFGMVLIEAMAASVPVVATRVPGIVDVVRDGVTGLLVPARNPTLLADAIKRLAGDNRLQRSLVLNATNEVRERFTWDRVLPRYADLLRSATSRI